MEFQPDQQVAVKNLLADFEKKEQKLRAELNEVSHAKEIVQELISCCENDWPLHMLALVDRERSVFGTLSAEEHPAGIAIDELRRNAKHQSDAIIRRFPGLLEEACKSLGLTLDPESRHPNYRLEQGFFRLKVDEQKRVFKLLDNEGTLAEGPADVSAIAKVVLRERKRVFERPFDGQSFLRQIRSQYLAIVRKNNQPDGTSVPIRQITRRLGKNVKGFRSDEFLIDLSRLIEQGPIDVDGCRLDLQQTKDTNQGMLLHGAAGRGYIGFVVFRSN